MVHADPDDLGCLGHNGNKTSLLTGNAGDRVACANIVYLMQQ
jgi:Cu/Zn superoxide dismutase